MRKTYCDRCGQLFEYGDKLLIKQSTYEVVLQGPVRQEYKYLCDRVDICPKCQEQLNTLVEDFMKGSNI